VKSRTTASRSRPAAEKPFSHRRTAGFARATEERSMEETRRKYQRIETVACTKQRATIPMLSE
jgi:hypothetical protein